MLSSISSRPATRRSKRIHSNPLYEAASLVTAAALTLALLTSLIIWLARQLVHDAPKQTGVGDWPTSAVPVPCHSHNDYWREVPVLSALRIGCIGVEADVWAYEDDLFLGHKRDALSPDRTFKHLYVDTLVQLLRERNPVGSKSIPRGLYDFDPAQTLVLLVDIKAAPEKSWSLLEESLEPLRQHDWLTSIKDDQIVTTRPVTVVVTGKVPEQALSNASGLPRFIFLDAPLSALDSNRYHQNNSYWASGSFAKTVGWVWFGTLRSSQLDRVRSHVKQAHSQGLRLRYWNLPIWPVALRDHIWELLMKEGLDVINVDDLRSVAETWPRLRPSWPTTRYTAISKK